MTDFPRGWTLSVDVAGPAVASITIPIVAGVVHVLDAFSAKLTNTSAVAVFANVQLSSSDGTFTNMVLTRLGAIAAAAGSVEADSGSGSELNLAPAPGASITVAFSAGFAGGAETLLIQGHDI